MQTKVKLCIVPFESKDEKWFAAGDEAPDEWVGR